MGKYVLYFLKGCPYSIATYKMFRESKVDLENSFEKIEITRDKKELYTEGMIDEQGVEHFMSTFPQIYYYPKVKENQNSPSKVNKDIYEVIGGCDDFEEYKTNKTKEIKSYKKVPNKKILKLVRESITKRFP